MVSEDEFQPLTSDDDDDFLDLPFEEERPKDLPKTKATGIRPAKKEIVESWDVLKEPKPNHKVYSDSFQQALLDGSLIGTSLSAALRQVEEYKFKFDRQKELKIYQQEAEVLENFSFSDGMTIGVLGQTGVGKSSLICSLTGVPGIAETSCLGASCTSVPIEYRKKTDHHSSVFHVEIVHFSGEELTDYVKELVFDYVRYWLPSAADADADEYKELEQSHVTAWTCLSTAFGKQQKDFDTESWKKEAHEGQYQRITEMFAKWTEQLQWPDGVNESGVWTADANSIEEWRKALSAFTKQGLWPFIKVVRNFSDSELLKTGIVIADLPGFGDTNLARVRATQQYLMRCDHLFMLTKITRAITDESLQSIIEKSMEKYASIDLKANARSQLALSIVCTHSESIDEDDVLESFCCEGGLIDPEEMKAFDEKMENAKSQKVYYQLQREKKLLLISARNTHVQNGLQEVYGGRIPGLKVFCISNRLYSKCVVKDKTLWGTHVETSGIPELRKYCRLLAAEDQYRDGENFLVSKISALLNKVSIWIETRAMSHFATNLDPRIAQQLVADVDSAKVAMTKTLHDHRKSFRTAIDDHVLSLFREHSNEWNDAALAKFKEFVWPNWHWTSFGAFIRHSGFRDKGKHKDEDWNQQLSEKMRSDITVPWDAYADGVPAELEKVYNDIERGFQALKPKFERPQVPEEIPQSVDILLGDIQDSFQRAADTLVKELRVIKATALGFNAASLFFKEISLAYKTACTFSGKGTNAKQRAALIARFEEGNVFTNMQSSIKKDVDVQIDNRFRSLVRKVEKECGELHGSINLATREKLTAEDRKYLETFEKERTKLAQTLVELKKRHGDILKSVGLEKTGVKASGQQAAARVQ